MAHQVSQDAFNVIMKHYYSFKYTKLMTECIDEFIKGRIPKYKFKSVFQYGHKSLRSIAHFCRRCGQYGGCHNPPHYKVPKKIICICGINHQEQPNYLKYYV